MPKLDAQISTLQQKLVQLKLRQQHIDARRRALQAHRERKSDTRKKILLGGLVMDKIRQGALDHAQMQAWLDQALTRAADRALFELPPLEAAPLGAAPPDPAASAAPGSDV